MDKELIYLLYISDGPAREDLHQFSKSSGFALKHCDDPLSATDMATQAPPDLIVIECDKTDALQTKKNIANLDALEFKFKPAIFLVVHQLPDSDERLSFMQQGLDRFLMSPVLSGEVKEEYKIFQKVKYLEQTLVVQTMKLEKSFTYLDQFKTELKKVKTTLFEERETLNNALKQVNQMTIERNRLKKEKRDIKDRLLTNVEGFFDILSRLIEARVEKNRGHGERVSHVACFIAKQLKFDEKRVEDLKKAAMLHEVGLLLVPEVTLNKAKDQLSDYEKDLFAQYPVKGAQFFLNCSEFNGCAQIIQSMNENSDGSGRPDGLKRRYIPLLSRILAGADVFDTLKDQDDVTSLEIFLEKLEGFAGTRLDPNIVAWLEKYAVLHMGSDSYRVKGVGIHQLEPGMALGTALFTHTGTKLFSVNTLLTHDAIDKIKNYNREYPVDETVYIRV
ncbi:MAG: HD domain-containing phosphohydrolase [Pseudomonadota bacterium]